MTPNDTCNHIIDTFAQEYDTRPDQILKYTSISCVDRLPAYCNNGLKKMVSGEFTRGCLMPENLAQYS